MRLVRVGTSRVGTNRVGTNRVWTCRVKTSGVGTSRVKTNRVTALLILPWVNHKRSRGLDSKVGLGLIGSLLTLL